MANKVLLKKSSVAGKVPLTTDLDFGELALNYADGKLYFKTAAGAIGSFSTAGGSSGGGQFTFSSTAPSSPAPGDEWLHSTTGIKYTYVDDGSSQQWVAIETESSISTGGSGGATTLDGLTDVDTSTTPPANGDVLSWNSASSQWVPTAPAAAGFSNVYTLTATTTNATETEAFVSGSAGVRIPVATNKTVFYTAEIACRRTDASGDHGAWFIKGVASNNAGAVTDIGALYEVIVARTDSAMAVDLRADDANNSVGVYVTGATGKTVSWRIVVTTVEV